MDTPPNESGDFKDPTDRMKRYFRPTRGLGLALLGAVLYAGAFPPLEWAPLGWLAPLCLLVAVHHGKTSTRFRLLFCTGYVVAALDVFWLWNLFRVATLFLWAIFAFYFGLWGLLAGNGEERSPWARILRPAAAWCGVEYFRSELAPLCFSWLSLGYSQQNAIGTILAPWVGVYGISFVMVLWGGGLLEAFRRIPIRARNGPRTKPTVLVAAVAMAVPLLALVPIPRWAGIPLATVALQQFKNGDEPGVDDRLVIDSFSRPVDLAVWPEYSFASDPQAPTDGWVLDTVHPVAAGTRWGLIFGALQVPEGQTRHETFCNTAWFLSPEGSVLGAAVKNQPIQLINDGRPADDVTVLPVAGVSSPRRRGEPLRLGVGICYDGSYQRFARRMASRGGEVLVFPTYNAEEWGGVQHRQHQRLFQMRAMETGLPVVTAAFSGPTFVAAPNGRSLTVLPFHTTELLYAELPSPRDNGTPFLCGGWWTGPLGVLAASWFTGVSLFGFVASRLDRIRGSHKNK